MTAPAGAADTTAGLSHLGVLYDSLDALVEAVGPRIAGALADGDDVYLSVDRRTARGLREWLGPAGDRVEYPSPVRWPLDLARDLRDVVRPGRRTLVLGQYGAGGVSEADYRHREDCVNLVLADLPLTLLCTCAGDADPDLLASLRGGHPELLVDGSPVPNPDFRAPRPCCPTGAALWGPPTLRWDFRAPEDLHRLREHVTRAAEAVGLRGDMVREAVLATHEAAVLAAGGPGPVVGSPVGPGTGGAVPCVLEVRAEAGALYCEVLGPRPEDLDDVVVGRNADDPLHVVRLFCDRALSHDEADGRTVRVLRAPDGIGAPGA